MAEAILIAGGMERQRAQSEGELSVTLRELAEMLHPGSEEFLAPTIALADGKPVLRENDGWNIHIPPSGIVIFIELPMGGGGGSNPLSVLFSIVAVAVMWWNPGAWVAGTMGLTATTAAGATALTTGGLLVAGLVNGGILMGASMLAGALIGTPKLSSGLSGAYDAAAASPTYNVNASGNQARLYQPEPEGFGRMRIVPDYIASPWTQYLDNEQYGYFVYALGRGRYDVESMNFGDTVFWRKDAGVDSAYDNVQVQFVEAGDKVTLFPDNVVTSSEVSGQELIGPSEILGPYAANPPGTETNQIQLDIVLPRGIGWFNDYGGLQGHSVSVKAEYRKIDDWGVAQGEWATLSEKRFGGATMTPQRHTLLCDVAPGRYEVRMIRMSNSAGDGRTLDAAQWTAMRAILPGSLTYDVSAVAIRLRATNTLSNSASSKFSLIATRKAPLYDRTTRTWSEEVPTRSWAAAVSAVCRASWGGGLQDREIDLDGLWRIDEGLQARGWFYDAYIDGPYNIWPLVTEMCQCVMCVPRIEGPVLSFVEDRGGRPPRYMLTPRNIRRGSFRLTWNTWSKSTPDDVIMNYLDNAYAFQQRDVKAVLPESESREEYSLEMLGVTDREHAFRLAVAYAARNRWRRVGVECQVEGLGRLMNRGDVVTVSHPRLRNTASGKLDSWDKGALSLTLRKDTGDVPAMSEQGNGLYLALCRPDGSVWGPCRLERCEGEGGEYRASFNAEDYAGLIASGLDAPWDWMADGEDSLPTLWTLQTSREFTRRMLVQSVVANDLWNYTVSLVNDDERAYGYENLPVPPWEGRGQLPGVNCLSAPQGLSVTVRGTAESPVLTAGWLPVRGATVYEVEISTDGQNWTPSGQTSVNRFETEVRPGLVWLRVCAIGEGLQSGWADWSGDTRLMPPGELTATARLDGAELIATWTAAEDAESYVVNVRHGGIAVATISVSASQETREYRLTPQEARDFGGPWREVSVGIWGVNAAGPGPVATAGAYDSAPSEVVEVDISKSDTSITLNSVTLKDGDADVTGYVLLQGATPDFDSSSMTGMQIIEALPYTLSDLTPVTTYYFRLAAKDKWFDDANMPFNLNYSAVLGVATEAANA